MKSALRVAVVAAAATLLPAACGGGGSSDGQPVGERPVTYPPLPPQTTALARQAPIVDLGGTLHIGADIAPSRASLTPGPSARGVVLSSGTVSDGISRDEILAYLRYDASEYAQEHYADGLVARFASTPPIVRVAEGTPPELVHVAVHAVQLINASLPHDWQLRFSGISVQAGAGEVAEGQIVIEFAPRAEWHAGVAGPGESCVDAAGCADWSWSEVSPPRILGGKIWIDPDLLPGIHLQSATVHELIHLLGRLHGDPQQFTSVMASSQLSGHFLFPLDREALFAVYGWLPEEISQPEDLTSRFGLWSDTSLHIRGDIGNVDGAAFGVRYSFNGLSQPWAYGPTPHANLADNMALSGTASWSGLLLGYGLESVVAGDADLSVALSTLRGNLDFSNLRALTDISSETAVTWGDGDLSYRVRVRGNTFVQSGGDAGIVTGIFVGAEHEGMAGTLHRDDLAAAFGGTR